jgi:hypothetical protein
MDEKLTFKKAHAECKRMWNILADTGGKQKKEAIVKMGYKSDTQWGGDIRFDCFACEYTRKTTVRCDLCPISWGRKSRSKHAIRDIYCERIEGSPYKRWISLTREFIVDTPEIIAERKRLAKIIANKKWTNKIKEEING